MDLIGKRKKILTGMFSGSEAQIVEIKHNELTLEIELFGKKTTIRLKPNELDLDNKEIEFIDNMNKEKTDSFAKKVSDFSIDELIIEFDSLYNREAPIRYKLFNVGSEITTDVLIKKFKVSSIPEEYVKLYNWKNGQQFILDYKNEFEQDSFFDIIPLDDNEHFLSIESAIDQMNQCESTNEWSKKNDEKYFWKDGFIPMLYSNSGYLVLDTIGYFGGKPFQLVSCNNGGFIVSYENIKHWLYTQILLLKFGNYFYYKTDGNGSEIEWDYVLNVMRYYKKRFPEIISL